MTTGRLIVPDTTGHTTVEWDKTDEASVSHVKSEFEKIMRAGGMVADTSVRGAATQVREFDPEVAEYTVIAPLVGG